MMYTRLAEGVTKYKLIPSTEDVWNHITTNDKDWYVSLFKYNQEQYNKWKESGTVAGMTGLTSQTLFFDFDDAKNLEQAKEDATELVTRLVNAGIALDNIQIAYSGMKGFSVSLDITDTLTQEEFKSITFALAEDLKSFDRVVNDNQRIVRVVGTKHNKSGLYKIPLTIEQLSLPISEIKALASSLDNVDTEVMQSWTEVVLPKTILDLKTYKKTEKPKVTTEIIDSEINFAAKPKWLSEAKYALQMGYFGEGERNNAFMILASTYKAQGFPLEVTYRMLKGVAEIQAKRNNQEQFDSEELWEKIAKVVYSPTWRGATYSYQNTPLLQEVTARLGLKVENSAESSFVTLDSVTGTFRKFAEQIDKNTIKLGIPSIDNNVRVTTSMLVGLLAAPSAGKTSISLSVLNTASRNNVKAGFFSLDMGAPLVYQRLIQKHTGVSGKKIFEMYKNKDKGTLEFEKVLSEQYKNVSFCFKSGITPENVRQFIQEENQKNPENPMKLLVVDYLECIQGPYSDATANTALIAQQLKDIANDLEMCIILLLQPQKHAGDPSSELLNYRQIKGSSAIEQAASVIFTLWRPGFSPKNPGEDRYASIAVVKNRMGSLGTYEFNWNGLTGELSELDEAELEELGAIKKRRAAEKEAADKI